MDGTIGVITCFAGSYAPKNYAFCNGQLLSIPQNSALFSILGNTYGGDGVSTFALPDLRGRTPVSVGQQGGGQNYNLGQQVGAELVTLTPQQLPAHNHNGEIHLQLAVSVDDGIDPTPNNQYPSRFTGAYSTAGGGADSNMLASTYNVSIGNVGAGTPMDIRAPFLAVNYIICLNGIYPGRN